MATSPRAAVTAQQRRFYSDNGYLVVEGLLPAAECDAVSNSAERLAAGHHSNLLNLHERSPEALSLLCHPRLLAVADALQGARMIPIGSIFFFCKPGNPLENGAAPHQDNYAPKSPYGSYFVIGLALDDADRENGSLVVYPGTHKLGDLPGKQTKNFEVDAAGKITKAYPIGNAVKVPAKHKPVQLEYSKGSAIFIHGHLVHSAAKNPSRTRWRRKIYLHYIKDGDPFWPGWNARRRLIERGDAVPLPADEEN